MRAFWASAFATIKRFISNLATATPLRISVVGIVFVSLVLAIGRTVPVVNRDRVLLRQVHELDVRGLSLEGDLQSEVERSRAQFLEILLASTNPVERDAEIASLRRTDLNIDLISRQVILLGVNSGSWQDFAVTWEHHAAIRDAQIAMVLQGRVADALRAEKNQGQVAFQQVEEIARSAKTTFEHSSADRIQELTASLRTAAAETLLLLAFTIASLFLLLALDSQRTQTQRKLDQATLDLRASEDRFRQAYESAGVGMGIFRLDGTIVSANRTAAEILGYDQSEMIGMKVSQFMAPEHRDDLVNRIASLPASGNTSYQVERRVLRKDGTAAWVRNSVTLLKFDGQADHYFSITEEITKQKMANDRLTYLASNDPVTNLPSLCSFEHQLSKALEEHHPGADGSALIYLEIDSFDFLKGTYGRTAADRILAEVGARLTAFRREGELVGRIDDHVFGMLVRAAAYDEATLHRAAELMELFRRSGESDQQNIPLSVSIGIAYSNDSTKSSSSDGSGGDPTQLMTYARAAMLEAQTRGGDSFFVADPGLQERAARRRQIELALLQGLRDNEFRVIFQPQFEIATGRLVRFEALCRWDSAELGPIPPDQFIPLAEQTGLMMEIGRRVMADALREAKKWIDTGRNIGLAVNISPLQFMRPDFTVSVVEFLTQTKFPAEFLELEITEGVFIRDLNLAISRIRELKRLGLTIALDDFGTGYSSLSYLQRMPINAVKLDRSFVRDLTTDPATVSMVRSVLAMADALKLRVVTEGVETEQQLEILRALGCNEAQGYLLGRPETAEMALKRVLNSPHLPIGTLAREASTPSE